MKFSWRVENFLNRIQKDFTIAEWVFIITLLGYLIYEFFA